MTSLAGSVRLDEEKIGAYLKGKRVLIRALAVQ
jgi:hypothetical protein